MSANENEKRRAIECYTALEAAKHIINTAPNSIWTDADMMDLMGVLRILRKLTGKARAISASGE